MAAARLLGARSVPLVHRRRAQLQRTVGSRLRRNEQWQRLPALSRSESATRRHPRPHAPRLLRGRQSGRDAGPAVNTLGLVLLLLLVATLLADLTLALLRKL